MDAPRLKPVRHWLPLLSLVTLLGCGPTEGERFRDLQKEINALKVDKIQLEERLERRDARIADYESQLKNLRTEGRAQPKPVFEIDRIDILDITGGLDADSAPGDDHIAVYFRPIDRDGDVLKRAGKIEVTLLDAQADPAPKVIGRSVDNDPERIRKLWYGKFWTNHYKVEVPITNPAKLVPGQEVDVFVRFEEFATGRTFTDRKVVKIKCVLPD